MSYLGVAYQDKGRLFLCFLITSDIISETKAGDTHVGIISLTGALGKDKISLRFNPLFLKVYFYIKNVDIYTGEGLFFQRSVYENTKHKNIYGKS